MTIILNPSVLPDAQTYYYISDYVQVVDYDGVETNTVISIANVSNITFSVSQSRVTVNVSNNRIWFNGYYTTGASESFSYIEPPAKKKALVNNTIVVESSDNVPARKLLYSVNQPLSSGVTVTHNFKVNYSNGGNSIFTVDRLVYTSIYSTYNFLNTYEWYEV